MPLLCLQDAEGRLGLSYNDISSSAAARQEKAQLVGDQWASSTPDGQDGDPVGFDGGRVRAWLTVQNLTPPEGRSSCSKAVQTEEEAEVG